MTTQAPSPLLKQTSFSAELIEARVLAGSILGWAGDVGFDDLIPESFLVDPFLHNNYQDCH